MAGGLATYGADIASQYRRAASYVDRILKGKKPAELPLQTPTKYYGGASSSRCSAARQTAWPLMVRGQANVRFRDRTARPDRTGRRIRPARNRSARAALRITDGPPAHDSPIAPQ